MKISSKLDNLIKAFKIIPGVGNKTAYRAALYLLEHNREGALSLSSALNAAALDIGYCLQCRMLSESDMCDICIDMGRLRNILCVVESHADVLSLEKAGYQGLYFVLKGFLSPLDGIGPDEIGVCQLESMLNKNTFDEVILANSAKVEGEATAAYIARVLAPKKVKITRIAYGIPLGGELELIDEGTLAHALLGRRLFI